MAVSHRRVSQSAKKWKCFSDKDFGHGKETFCQRHHQVWGGMGPEIVDQDRAKDSKWESFLDKVFANGQEARSEKIVNQDSMLRFKI